MNGMISTLSYGGKQPSILAKAFANRPSDWGSKKCPCCKGNASSDVVVCNTCLRDAKYDKNFAAKVRQAQMEAYYGKA
jgi:hypothetical protein